MKEKIINFVNDVTKEMKKVTWPTRDELRESTVVVIATTVVFALVIFAIDAVFTRVMNMILGA